MNAIGDERSIREPILIVGSPRSGTTLLGNLLARHPDVAYWEEPRTIWSQGNAWLGDDRLEREHLTPSIARKIDASFHRFVSRSGRTRFAEKTPSNTLRLPFIHALYPDSRVIHLLRDGRAVVASMLKMLSTPPRSERVVARLRETPWRDFPALMPLAARELVRRLSPGSKVSFWGPRPPGWREWLELPTARLLARQWQVLTETARQDLLLFPKQQRLEIRYEDLLADPGDSLEKIHRLTGLHPSSAAFGEQATAEISQAPAQRWRRELDADTIALIEAEATDLLESLNYPLVSKST